MSSLGDGAVRSARLPRTARRRQLLDAALSVFVVQGYHAAAMDDIAEKAGVSKPVLYQHFPGKRDLYLALLDESASALMESVRAAMASTTDNKARVLATVRAYYEFIDHHNGAFRLVFESDLTGESEVRDRVDAVERQCAEATAALIAEDTGLPEAEARLLGAGLAGIAQVTARSWAAGGEGVPREVAIDLVSRLIWRGIRGFPRADERP
ncbi:MAG: TetR/AcrR family transcriptional regulator [Sporichthyaceae bacterium]